MNSLQLAELRAMPWGERIRVLLAKKEEHHWSAEQYATVLRETHVPFTRLQDAENTPGDEADTVHNAPSEAVSESGTVGGEDEAVQLPTDKHSDVASHPISAKGLSQKARILELLQDGNLHSTVEIMDRVYRIGEDRGNCNIKARIDELRNEGNDIPKATHIKGTLYGYRLNKVIPFYGG